MSNISPPEYFIILTVNNATPDKLVIASPVGCSPGIFLQQPSDIPAGGASSWVAIGDSSGIEGVVATELFDSSGDPVAILQFQFRSGIDGRPNDASGGPNNSKVVVSQTAFPPDSKQWSVSFTISPAS
jgi:hypothetical protein